MRSALGGRLGYQGMRPSVAVFFDSESGCGQKVGIAINGSSVDGCAAGVAPPFDLYGSPVTVWVAYDAASTTLQVFLAQDTNKPAAPLLAQTVDIRATVGPAAFVGFTAATGSSYMNHDLLNWRFTLETTLPRVAAPTQTPAADAEGQSTLSATCSDLAGSQGSASVQVQIDKTAPVVAVTGVSEGAVYLLGSVPAGGAARAMRCPA